MPRTSYHKLYSGTFLSGTVKCRGRYTVNRLYALEDPLKKYTFSNTQPENIFLVTALIMFSEWIATPGLKLGKEFWIRPEIGYGKSHSLVKTWQGKKHTACRANLTFLG